MSLTTTAFLLALICAPGIAAQIGWQFTFDSADFAGGKYGPTITDGMAHYALEHGYIANVRQEFRALQLAEHPFFGDACACAAADLECEGGLLSFDRALSKVPGIERVESVGTA